MINLVIRLLSKFFKQIEGNPDEFLERPYKREWREFIVGSCKGIYRTTNNEYEILAVVNTKKNDNFDTVLTWFKKSAKRDKYNLSFLEVGNPKFKQKLGYGNK